MNDFASRVDQENRDSHLTMNQEALLNIVRASHHQSLSFVAITSVGASRQEDLKIGLPSITLGPNLTPAQKQFSFSGNTIGTSNSGNFQSQPLVDTTFQEALLMPISTRQMAMLVAARGREPVWLAALDEVLVSSQDVKETPDITKADICKDQKCYQAVGEPQRFYLRNEISDEPCSVREFAPDVSDNKNAFLSDDVYVGYTLVKISEQFKDKARLCKGTMFRALLKAFLYAGLTVDIDETVAADTAKSKDGDDQKGTKGNKDEKDKSGKGGKGASGATAASGSDSKSTTVVGRLCVDPALIEPEIVAHERNAAFGDVVAFPMCMVKADKKKQDNPSTEDTSTLRVRHFLIGKDGEATAYEYSFRVRSPMAVFKYLGSVLRTRSPSAKALASYTTKEAVEAFETDRSTPLLNIQVDNDKAECAVEVAEGGHDYCIARSDYSSLNMLALLQDLRNLNIHSSELNSPFTVRVTQ